MTSLFKIDSWYFKPLMKKFPETFSPCHQFVCFVSCQGSQGAPGPVGTAGEPGGMVRFRNRV